MIKLRSEKRLFWYLACLMAVVVLVSNYLVQFPVSRLGLDEILTYGAFSYPIAFLITDLANRKYGKLVARQIVYFGFIVGVFLTLYFSTNFSDLISIRIAIGSGTAFFIAKLIANSLESNSNFTSDMVSVDVSQPIKKFIPVLRVSNSKIHF